VYHQRRKTWRNLRYRATSKWKGETMLMRTKAATKTEFKTTAATPVSAI